MALPHWAPISWSRWGCICLLGSTFQKEGTGWELDWSARRRSPRVPSRPEGSGLQFLGQLWGPRDTWGWAQVPHSVGSWVSAEQAGQGFNCSSVLGIGLSKGLPAPPPSVGPAPCLVRAHGQGQKDPTRPGHLVCDLHGQGPCPQTSWAPIPVSPQAPRGTG